MQAQETNVLEKRWPVVFIVGLLAATVWAGCMSQHEETESPDGERRTIDARARSFLLQGDEAFQRGSYQRALALADSAEKYEPDAAVTHFFRGSIYTALNQFEAARQAYQKVIDIDPTYPEVHQRMGDNAAQRGNLREALRLYERAEEVASSSALYVAMGQAYAELGRADSARWAYARAVARDSTNARAHLLYGQFLAETGELETALHHARRAVALEPANANYQFTLGSQLYQLDRLEAAVPHLRRAAEARLLHYPAQYTLGQVLLRLDRAAEGRHYLARADSARRLMDQLTIAQKAATQHPNEFENWMRVGTLFRTAGEYNQALEAFGVAANLQPENLSVQHQIATVMLANGNREGAIRRLQAILEADRTRLDAWLNLGLAYAAGGNCAEAKRSWQTALEHHPDDTRAQEYLAGLCQYTSP